MADPGQSIVPILSYGTHPGADRVFYQALCLFEHLRIYANAINDITVPYPTAAIETEDPFFNRATNGIEMYAEVVHKLRLCVDV